MTTRILVGHVLDRLAELPDDSVHCCVTSPPYYGLRDYGIEPQAWPDGWRGSLGLEPTPALYIEHMVAVFREVRRVLHKDGTLWLNIGDSYASSAVGVNNNGQGKSTIGYRADGSYSLGPNGSPYLNKLSKRQQAAVIVTHGCKPKDLLGIPWALAFALRDDGWYLRSEITWAKKAPMPESVTDRPTSATEKVFLFAKSARYFYDAEAVKEEAETDPKENYAKITGRGTQGFAHARGNDRDQSGGFPVTNPTKRNMRNWWLLGPEPFPEAHFATFPTEIPRRAIMAGCPAGRVVLDPFLGAGTTALVADQLGRDCIGIELNPEYAAMAQRRIEDDAGMFADIAAD